MDIIGTLKQISTLSKRVDDALEIKQAVEKIFNVKVVSVNTLHRIGKRQRTRFGYGKRADQKRAIVTLAAGQQIDVFGNN